MSDRPDFDLLPGMPVTRCPTCSRRQVGELLWLPCEKSFVGLYHDADGYHLDGDRKFLGVDWADGPVRIEAVTDAEATAAMRAWVRGRWYHLLSSLPGPGEVAESQVTRVLAYFTTWHKFYLPLRERFRAALPAASWDGVLGDASDATTCDYDALAAAMGVPRDHLSGDPFVRVEYADGGVRFAQGFAGAELLRAVVGDEREPAAGVRPGEATSSAGPSEVVAPSLGSR